MRDRRPDVWIKPTRSPIGRHGCVDQPRVPTGLHEPGKQVWVASALLEPVDESQKSLRGVTKLHLVVLVEIVRNRQVWIELESPLERLMRSLEVFFRVLAGVQAHHPVDPAQPGPRGGESRIFLEALQIQVTSRAPCGGLQAELVRRR